MMRNSLLLNRKLLWVIACLFGIGVFLSLENDLLVQRNTAISESGYHKSLRLAAPSAAAATGTLFHGERVAQFDGPRRFSGDAATLSTPSHPAFPQTGPLCDKWGVVTTINAPTESVRTFAGLSDWCLVIVADTKTPNKTVYLEELLPGKANDPSVVFLSVEEQEEQLGQIPLVKRIPWRSFARKNIGFLYAIRHGAQAIFDFDDDNVLKDDVIYQLEYMPTKFRPQAPETDVRKLRQHTLFVSPNFPAEHVGRVSDRWTIQVPQLDEATHGLAYNPLPHMRASTSEVWPRGFPLDDVRASVETIAPLSSVTIPVDRVGVIQAVCDLDPDVDAVFRLTRQLPVEFDDNPALASRLLIPPGKYTPYNAQATIHLRQAFWGLFLPYTVPGRVTDIWRAYFSERIFHQLELAVLYSPPTVLHHRSAHNYIADMQAENDLYMKTSKLLEFLSSTKFGDEDISNSTQTLPAALEKLYIDLYEHDYIGLEDVYAMQDWLSALVEMGYEFPDISGKSPLSTALRPAGMLHDQAYRIGASYNGAGDHGEITFEEFIQSRGAGEGTPELWEEWKHLVQKYQEEHPDTVPSQIKFTSFLMAKNQWPMIRDNVLYQGHLAGFENLYIFDGSDDVRTIAFLRYARDHLGANVVFTKTSLNRMEQEISSLARTLKTSSDLMTKGDVDEFWGLFSENGTCQTNPEESNCQISPYTMATFLKDRANLGYYDRFHNFRVQHTVLSGVNDEICKDELDSARFQFFVIDAKNFKGVTDARVSVFFDLGGHAPQIQRPHADGSIEDSRFGVIHLHNMCKQDVAQVSWDVAVGHGFIDAGDSNEVALGKLAALLEGDNVCEATVTINDFPSWHKVPPLARYLAGCDDPYAFPEGFTHHDYSSFLREARSIYY